MSDNSQDIENKQEIVVTEAMIEAGIVLLDDWLCHNLREMCEEGHTGYRKQDFVASLLQLQC